MHGGDLTRSSFDPTRHFSGVYQQQGRVQLDADWNEQLDIEDHHDRTEVLDAIGAVGAPKVAGGFALSVAPGGGDLLLSPGRMWVRGALCEHDAAATPVTLTGAEAVVATLVLDGRPLRVQEWVRLHDAGGTTATARITAIDAEAGRLTLSPAPAAPTAPATLRRVTSYATQPDFATPPHTVQAEPNQSRTLSLPDGAYLAYLDVWQRAVTSLEDPTIRERALGGADTATRRRTIWQLRLLALPGAPATLDCHSDLSNWMSNLAPPTGTMAAEAVPDAATTDLCTPTPAGGYTGLENQLYRVQVHDVRADGRPIIVWSRDNGSVVTAWSATTGDRLRVASIGRDRVLGFAGDQWVELLDDARELDRVPGTLVRLLKAEGDELTIAPLSADGSVNHADFGGGNAKVRRWDSDGTVTVTFNTALHLEQGVQVRFAPGTYRRGDYWLVPARASIADVEWPRDSLGRALQRPPDGVRHDVGKLALIRVTGTTITVTDCRDHFPSLTTLTAADVAFDDAVCALPGVDTVQEALDQLCRSRDLRRHHKLLHGWGVVCGLQVECGPDDNGHGRRNVTVRPGTAIDCEGEELDVTRPTPIDMMAMVERLQQTNPAVLDERGNGDVCLIVRSDVENGVGFDLEVDDPSDHKPPKLLNRTLLMDMYNECLKSLHDWLRSELKPAPDDGPAGPVHERISALTNLLAEPINPKSGRNVFLSQREDTLLQRFYAELKSRLQSETFCAMFEKARAPEPYPSTLGGMDTIFGTGSHTRLRTRPRAGEAYTVGAGANPLKTAAVINRYDLKLGKLIERVDPVAGRVLNRNEHPAAGTGAVADVAFSPDGRLIYVVVPTRNEENTVFRVGQFVGQTIQWRPMITICGVKLVTLATTVADRDAVYAVGLRKVDGEWHGKGLYRINPTAEIDPNMSPLDIPGFFPVGHLLITPTGVAVATAVDSDVPVRRYTRLVQVRVPSGTTANLPVITLGANGEDDVAILRGKGEQPGFAFTVVNTPNGKGVVGHNLATGVVTHATIDVQSSKGAVRLLALPGLLAVTSADEYILRIVDLAKGNVTDGLPLQVGPMSIATDPDSPTVNVLNTVSNTISVILKERLKPGAPFDFAGLRAYRKAMIEAYADLLAGFLQYLKDCLFDHFLVRCPQCDGSEKLYLACVSIRARQVYKICNFSRRRQVKSFPAIGYWMSVVPVLPFAKEGFGRLACSILPDFFSKLTVNESGGNDRVSVQWLQRALEWAQSTDVLDRFQQVRRRTTVARTVALMSLAQAPKSTASARTGRALTTDVVGRPADDVERRLTELGVTVRRQPFGPGVRRNRLSHVTGLFRDARPGDEVTIFEEGGAVRSFSVSKSTARPEADSPVAETQDQLAERVTSLERQLAGLRDQIAGAGTE